MKRGVEREEEMGEAGEEGKGGRRREERKGAGKERLTVTGLVENGPPCTFVLTLRKPLT